MRILLLLCSLLCCNAYAQLTVGSSQFGKFKDFRKGEYKEVKNKTTVFVVDDLNVDDFKKVVDEVWTFNNYEVISREDYTKEDYINQKYAPFKVEGFVRTTTRESGLTTQSFYVFYNFFHYDIKKKKNKDKVKRRTMAGVFLSGEPETISNTIASGELGNLSQGYDNYSLGYFKNQLQLINKELNQDGFYWAYDSDYNKKELKKLKKATLYVPDYFQIKMNAYNGRTKQNEKADDLFKNYDYNYEWITKDELSTKILNAKEDFYYLSWVRVNGQKFVNVINGLTGEIIYEDYEIMTYNIKKNDISRLASKIK